MLLEQPGPAPWLIAKRAVRKSPLPPNPDACHISAQMLIKRRLLTLNTKAYSSVAHLFLAFGGFGL